MPVSSSENLLRGTRAKTGTIHRDVTGRHGVGGDVGCERGGVMVRRREEIVERRVDM